MELIDLATIKEQDSSACVLTKNEVSKIVERSLKNCSFKLLNYYFEDFLSGEKIGFLGSHSHFIVVLKCENNRIKKLKYFVKSLPEGNKSQTDFILDKGIFKEEAFFYTEVVAELKKNCEVEKWAAKCYLSKEKMLIMEDLKSQGYEMGHQPLTIDELKCSLKSLANFHASSILAEFRLQKPLNKHFPEAFTEKLFSRVGRNYDWFRAGIDVCIAIAEKIGLKNSDKLPSVMERVFEIFNSIDDEVNVICHGDLWSNNLMFQRSKTEVKNCAFVDFQLVRYAPLGCDLAQLMYLNTTKSFRKSSQELEMLRFYHSILSEILKSNNKIINVASFDSVLKSYEKFRIFGKVISSVYFPSILLDGKAIEENIKDSDGFDNFVFNDRRCFVLKYMEENQDYRERLIETLEDLLDEVV